MDQVKLVRLVTGEELIGRMTARNSDKNTLSLKKILVLVVSGQDEKTGRPQMAMLPWMPYLKDEEKEISENSITLVSDLVKPLEDVYLRLTSSIQPASVLPEGLPDLSQVGKKLLVE